jgi:hypothetical protein
MYAWSLNILLYLVQYIAMRSLEVPQFQTDLVYTQFSACPSISTWHKILDDEVAVHVHGAEEEQTRRLTHGN